MRYYKLTQIGNFIHFFLLKAVVRLKIEKGDPIYLMQSLDDRPAFEKQTALAKGIMKKRRNVLHRLAQ